MTTTTDPGPTSRTAQRRRGGPPHRTAVDHALPFNALDVWHHVRVQLRAAHDETVKRPPARIQALPPSDAMPYGRCNFVLVAEPREAKVAGIRGHAVVQIRIILRPIGTAQKDTYPPLVYVQYLKPAPGTTQQARAGNSQTEVHVVDDDIEMFRVVRKMRGAERYGETIPLNDIWRAVQLIPAFGDACPEEWTCDNSVEICESLFRPTLSNFVTTPRCAFVQFSAEALHPTTPCSTVGNELNIRTPPNTGSFNRGTLLSRTPATRAPFSRPNFTTPPPPPTTATPCTNTTVASFDQSPLSPPSATSPRKRVVPKKSKLSLHTGTTRGAKDKSKDLSDIARRVGHSSREDVSTGRSFDIYVDGRRRSSPRRLKSKLGTMTCVGALVAGGRNPRKTARRRLYRKPPPSEPLRDKLPLTSLRQSQHPSTYAPIKFNTIRASALAFSNTNVSIPILPDASEHDADGPRALPPKETQSQHPAFLTVKDGLEVPATGSIAVLTMHSVRQGEVGRLGNTNLFHLSFIKSQPMYKLSTQQQQSSSPTAATSSSDSAQPATVLTIALRSAQGGPHSFSSFKQGRMSPPAQYLPEYFWSDRAREDAERLQTILSQWTELEHYLGVIDSTFVHPSGPNGGINTTLHPPNRRWRTRISTAVLVSPASTTTFGNIESISITTRSSGSTIGEEK
ncbi:hypothetical protein BD410DRAFT_809768 [Rickenella mellea]|uniref:DUF6830 domain-containing protein n=1 Tax=Rickenella mellea TaxID=50990 RepID=A0A4Y7PGA4_9AGAM|nr:hypothetical protein BD410DRAFT_809768 [Rickenella mellea]